MESDTVNNTGGDLEIRIASLNKREKQLREEIATIRKERSALKSQLDMPDSDERPKWLAELPKSFWYPTHVMSKLISSLNASVENKSSAPDLEDWQSTGGFKELMVNIIIGLGFALFVVKLMSILS